MNILTMSTKNMDDAWSEHLDGLSSSRYPKIGSASDYMGSILHLSDKMEELQKEINIVAEKAKKCSDYKEYEKSIKSYTTI